MNKYNALQKLVQLEYDMIKAYDAASAATDRQNTAAKLREFREDHVHHTENLGAVLENYDEDVPDGPGKYRWLTQGTVVLAGLVGLEYDLLAALHDNGETVENAYREALTLDDLDAAMQQTLQANHDDIARHRSWLKERGAAISKATATP